MDTPEERIHLTSEEQDVADSPHMTRLSQGYELLPRSDFLPSLNLSVKSWDDLSRDLCLTKTDTTRDDATQCMPTTNRSRDMQCTTESDEANSHRAKDCLLELKDISKLFDDDGIAISSRQSEKYQALSIARQWWQEWTLILTSIGIFIAIVVILRRFHNEPQPDWKLGLNLSTLIAILATLLRSSLVSIVEEGTPLNPRSY